MAQTERYDHIASGSATASVNEPSSPVFRIAESLSEISCYPHNWRHYISPKSRPIDLLAFMLARSAPADKLFAVVADETVFPFAKPTFGTPHNFITRVFCFRASGINPSTSGKLLHAFDFDSGFNFATLVAYIVYDLTISEIDSMMRIAASSYDEMVALSHL